MDSSSHYQHFAPQDVRIDKYRSDHFKKVAARRPQRLLNLHKAEAARQLANAPLLRLPKELRDMIYSYVFISPIKFCLQNGKVLTSKFTTYYEPFNRVQFVCRQLYEDTHDKECFQKNITMKMHVDIFKNMFSDKDQRLDMLDIHENKLVIFGEMNLCDNPDKLLLHDKLLRMAWLNPNASFMIILDELQFQHVDGRSLIGFLSRAGAILRAIRGDGRWEGSNSTLEGKWRERKSLAELNARNIRFFPRNVELDVEEFCRLASKSGYGVKHIIDSQYNGYRGHLLMEVKKWYEDGL
jgi:hypothetical protein